MSTITDKIKKNNFIQALKEGFLGFLFILLNDDMDEGGEKGITAEDGLKPEDLIILETGNKRADKQGDMIEKDIANSFGNDKTRNVSPKASVSEKEAQEKLAEQLKDDRGPRTKND